MTMACHDEADAVNDDGMMCTLYSWWTGGVQHDNFLCEHTGHFLYVLDVISSIYPLLPDDHFTDDEDG